MANTRPTTRKRRASTAGSAKDDRPRKTLKPEDVSPDVNPAPQIKRQSRRQSGHLRRNGLDDWDEEPQHIARRPDQAVAEGQIVQDRLPEPTMQELDDPEPYHTSYGGNTNEERDQRILGWVGGVIGAEDEPQHDMEETSQADDHRISSSVQPMPSDYDGEDRNTPRQAKAAPTGTLAQDLQQLHDQVDSLQPEHRNGARAFIAMLEVTHAVELAHPGKTAAEIYQDRMPMPQKAAADIYQGRELPQRRCSDKIPLHMQQRRHLSYGSLYDYGDYYSKPKSKPKVFYFDRDLPANRRINPPEGYVSPRDSDASSQPLYYNAVADPSLSSRPSSVRYTPTEFFGWDGSQNEPGTSDEAFPFYDQQSEPKPKFAYFDRDLPVNHWHDPPEGYESPESSDSRSQVYRYLSDYRPFSSERSSGRYTPSECYGWDDWQNGLSISDGPMPYYGQQREVESYHGRDYFPKQTCQLDYDAEEQPAGEDGSSVQSGFPDDSGSPGDSEEANGNEEAGSTGDNSRAAGENNAGNGAGGDENGDDNNDQGSQQDSRSRSSNQSDSGSGNNISWSNAPGQSFADHLGLAPRGGYPDLPFSGPQTRQNTAPNRMRNEPLAPGQGYPSIPIAEQQQAQLLVALASRDREDWEGTDAGDPSDEDAEGE